jgi:cell division protein ZapA
MKSIKITILDRKYPLRVEDEQEETMHQIARYVDNKFRQYKAELSKQPEATVMALSALSIAEELFEERQNNQQMNDGQGHLLEDVNQSMESLLEEIRG